MSIRQQFAKSWPTWGAIPKDHQELFFQHFKVTYSPLNELVQWPKWVAHVLDFFLDKLSCVKFQVFINKEQILNYLVKKILIMYHEYKIYKDT